MIACRSTAVGWLLVGMLAAGAGDAFGQWSQFRGPNGSGVDSAAGYPVEFSPTNNVVWKAAVPYGQSSPVVAGRHVYLTASEGDRLLTICLDAATGRELWRREIRRARVQKVLSRQRSGFAHRRGRRRRRGRVLRRFRTRRLHPRRQGPLDAPAGSLQELLRNGRLARSSPATWWCCSATSGAGRLSSRSIARPVVYDGDETVRRQSKDGPHRWCSARRRAPDATHRARLDAARRLRARDRRAALVVAARLEWFDGHARGARRHAFRLHRSAPPNRRCRPSPAYLEKLRHEQGRRLSAAEFSVDKDLGEHFGWIDADGDDPSTRRSGTRRETWASASSARSPSGRPAPGASWSPPPSVWRFQKNLPYIPAPLIYQDVCYMVKTAGSSRRSIRRRAEC